jgi:hypothetical protein
VIYSINNRDSGLSVPFPFVSVAFPSVFVCFYITVYSDSVPVPDYSNPGPVSGDKI